MPRRAVPGTFIRDAMKLLGLSKVVDFHRAIPHYSEQSTLAYALRRDKVDPEYKPKVISYLAERGLSLPAEPTPAHPKIVPAQALLPLAPTMEPEEEQAAPPRARGNAPATSRGPRMFRMMLEVPEDKVQLVRTLLASLNISMMA